MDNIEDVKKIQSIYKYMKEKNIDSITFNRNIDDEHNLNVYTIHAIINGIDKTTTVKKKERKTISQKLFHTKKPTKTEQNELIKDLINDINELKQKIKDFTLIVKQTDQQKFSFLSGILKILKPALSTLEKTIKD